MVNWMIYGIDQETKQAIKDQAKSYGCTIPYLLNLVFNDKEKAVINNKDQAWTIHGFTSQDISDIQRQAKSQDMAVVSFIKYMIKLGNEKIKDKKIVKDLTKDFVKSLYQS